MVSVKMLNDAKIKAAKGQDKAYKLTDSGQLYLLVKPTGARLWRMNYTARQAPGGPLKQKSLMFGTYPAVTLLRARRRRDEARELLRQGIDPGVKRRMEVAAHVVEMTSTFEVIARDWHTKQKTRWSKIHREDVLKSLVDNVFGEIGSRRPGWRRRMRSAGQEVFRANRIHRDLSGGRRMSGFERIATGAADWAAEAGPAAKHRGAGADPRVAACASASVESLITPTVVLVAGGLTQSVGPKVMLAALLSASWISTASSPCDTAVFVRIGVVWPYSANKVPSLR